MQIPCSVRNGESVFLPFMFGNFCTVAYNLILRRVPKGTVAVSELRIVKDMSSEKNRSNFFRIETILVSSTDTNEAERQREEGIVACNNNVI